MENDQINPAGTPASEAQVQKALSTQSHLETAKQVGMVTAKILVQLGIGFAGGFFAYKMASRPTKTVGDSIVS